MRMFVAVVPPEDVLEDLAGFLEPRQDDDRLRWTRPGSWHVTLAFMAHVPERALDELVERLGRAGRKRAALSLRVAGAGAFPGVARARVLYAGIDGSAEDLEELRRLSVGVRAAANKSGAPAAGQVFRPHLTVARMRHPVEATRWLRVLETYAGRPFDVDEFVLVRSHLAQGGGGRPRHEVVERFALGRGEDADVAGTGAGGAPPGQVGEEIETTRDEENPGPRETAT